MYDQTCNATFHEKQESIQYKAPLAITTAIGRTSNKELGLETIEKEGVTANCVAFFYIFRLPLSRIPIQYYSYFCEYIQHKTY